MSLLRLLNLGRAMPQIKGMGRYNLAKQHMLPTFGPQKKSDKADTKKIESRIEPSRIEPSGIVKIEGNPLPAGRLEGDKPVQPVVGWLKRANPFAVAPSAMPAEKSSQAAQSELSLEKVKVVRSDLSAADFEIIPKAPPGSTSPAKRYVRPEARPDALGKKAWGVLGARLFGNAAAKH